jgi:CPA2 family monovalent cation:H+ antiporter-2
VGRYVSDALASKGVDHLVVDYDAAAVNRARKQTSVLYGDATSDVVLGETHPEQAILAVVALPEYEMAETVVRSIRKMAPDLDIVARVHRGEHIPQMRAAGATAVIHAEFEAGAEMIRQTLDRLGFADPDVDGYLEGVRQHRYRGTTAIAE